MKQLESYGRPVSHQSANRGAKPSVGRLNKSAPGGLNLSF